MILGFYITCDDALCDDCFSEPGYTWPGFESWEEPLAILMTDESDTPTHCCECGELIDHPLTSDGYTYVEEYLERAVDDGESSSVERAWANAYGDGVSQIVLDAFNELPHRVEVAA